MKKYLYILLAIMTLVACSEDKEELLPGSDAEKNTTDVAVTGAVSKIGAFNAQISGVVNLASYVVLDVGIEVSTREDFGTKSRTVATGVVGRKFDVYIQPLLFETKYYYRTYVITPSLDYYGKTYSFTTKKLISVDDLYFVDLGLPSGTLWATTNIGASSPEDYGNYFAWGETKGYKEGKTSFTWSNYKWGDGSDDSINKYCTNSSCGIVDNKTELVKNDDAAYANWGEGWHIPTYNQLDELRTHCNWLWSNLNGIKGYYVLSKNNDYWLFLPGAGFRGKTSTSHVGEFGYYWSQMLFNDVPTNAWGLQFSNDNTQMLNVSRFAGLSIRPVRD